MNLHIEEKIAFISGSTKGIGFATALGLAKEGAVVWVNGRSENSVNLAKVKIEQRVPNARVYGIVADLSTAEGCEKVIQELPVIDILVNNLGIFEPKQFEDIPDEDWFRFFETNVMSGVRLSRHYLPIMKENNWGRILFVSSESALQIPQEMIHYGITKTAQIALARGLAESTKGTNVTVNSVLPGPSRSEGVEAFIQQIADQQGITFEEMEKEFFDNIRPSSLIQRFAAPSEVANMLVYLCGCGASATNGAAVRVDGGVVKSAF
jgi:NAD(P)-dependent dehydrogenase (short-subunit alcohol dehydrogenase family)